MNKDAIEKIKEAIALLDNCVVNDLRFDNQIQLSTVRRTLREALATLKAEPKEHNAAIEFVKMKLEEGLRDSCGNLQQSYVSFQILLTVLEAQDILEAINLLYKAEPKCGTCGNTGQITPDEYANGRCVGGKACPDCQPKAEAVVSKETYDKLFVDFVGRGDIIDLKDNQIKLLQIAADRVHDLEAENGRLFEENTDKDKEIERLKKHPIFSAFRPEIVCLCGSTRFMQEFFDVGWDYTLRGWIVLSVGVCKHTDKDGAHGGETLGQDVADKLDELHLRKIDMADLVFVLNVDGYIGKSTRKEIEYAKSIGKKIDYLVAEQALKGKDNENNTNKS